MPKCNLRSTGRVFLASLAWALGALAQTPAGEVMGRIIDPNGAVVPGARVTLLNVDTGAKREATSNNLGYYTVPVLPPGNYQASVQASGFKPITRSGIVLHVNQRAQIDFFLELGEVKEAVVVTANVPLLQTTEASLGAVVDNRKIADLPLNGRNPFDLVALTPGSVFYGRPSLPGNNIPLTNFSTNGGPSLSNEVLLDGIPNTVGQFNQLAIIPSIDATQEFKVQSNSVAAEFGRTGGGVVNVSLRSGSNQFHGTVYDFLRNDKLDANNWFNNQTGRARPPFRYNQFGGTLGGRIVRDKTFFFVSYEGLRQRTGKTFLFTVPREDLRQGDFSRLQTSTGQLAEVFDPLTTLVTPDGRGRVRDQFPGNRIPRSRMDPVAVKMLEYWPPPNLPGDPRTGANNFISTEPEKFSTNQANVRIDHNFASSHQFFGRLSRNATFVVPPNLFGNVANPASGPQGFTQWNTGVHDTWTITPVTIATFRLGFTRLRDKGEPLGLGFDITQLGFPAAYAAAQKVRVFPQMTVTGMVVSNIGFGSSSIGAVGSALLNNVANTYTAAGDTTLVRGRHVVKLGADARLFRYHGLRPVNGGGIFSFTSDFTQGPDPNRGGPAAGNAFASFLVGTVASGSIEFRDSQDYQSYYLAFFVQDDIRASSRLTLNLGLRWDAESSLTDRYNRLSFLDFDSPSPLQSPALGRQGRGGVGFVGVGGASRTLAGMALNRWAPRFGFAYQMARTLVVRGGYGIFYTPRTGQQGVYNGQEGFSSTTPHVASIDGFIPIGFLRDPFPSGFIQSVRSTQGLLTNVGLGVASMDRGQQASYLQQWNFAIQKSLPGLVAIEAAYAGSKGTRLAGDLQWNQIPDQFLNVGNELLRQVPNPFFGGIPANTSLGQSTIAQGQLLRPYPQFTGFASSQSTYGSSVYHSLQVRAERQFANGLTVLAAYTNGKLIDDGAPGRFGFLGSVPAYQNHNNRRSERSISSQEVSQTLVFSYVYELPIGPGKPFLSAASGWGPLLLGGWQVNGITSFLAGFPLALTTASNPTLGRVGSGNLRPDNNGRSAKLDGSVAQRLNRYFDTSVFSQPEPWKFGNTARTLPDVRTPGVANFDFSIVKNTTLLEHHRLQFRAEAFNVFNHPNFGGPNTVFGAPGFGAITSARAARIVQLALKWSF
ncbi:MAG: TonB-dependent receptor [Acidobacteria bacterium]|nr:TonB-dependent receptor [Acidobacteriota bacterium]